VIPDLEIWRAANLLIKRYGDKAQAEATARAEALAVPVTPRAAVWRRITQAVVLLVRPRCPA
jgi:hypothetical protein